MTDILVAPPSIRSLRLYVMPTNDFVPRVHQLNTRAQKNLNRMLRARRIHHGARLAMEIEHPTHIVRRSFPGHEPLPIRRGQRPVACLVGTPAAPILVRGTWMNDDPLGGRVTDPVFRESALLAKTVDRAWCVQLDDDPAAYALAALTLGAIASALAEMTRGFVMSWDDGVPYAHTPCFAENLKDWWCNPDFDPTGSMHWQQIVDDLRTGKGMFPSWTARRGTTRRERQEHITELMGTAVSEAVLRHIEEVIDSASNPTDAIRDIRDWLSAHDRIMELNAVDRRALRQPPSESEAPDAP